jgi:hypothetical protein
MHTVGFDPGGEHAFGWAVVEFTNGTPRLVASGTCTGAPRALAAASGALVSVPAAVGIDAPLFWVSAGDREADSFVRRLVCDAGGHSGTVSHVNSLRGACLVQGILAAKLAATLWPEARLTEAHPKALLLASSTAREFVTRVSPELKDEHQRDAALAAYTAFALASRVSGWHDLVDLDSEPFFPSGTVPAYWFPKQRT